MDFMTFYKQIKNGALNNLTFITGDEPYLIDNLTKYLSDNFLMAAYRDFNYTVYDNVIDVDTLINVAMTLPFFDTHRMILLNGTGLLKTVKDDAEEKLIHLLQDIPEHLYLVIAESELDKRKKVYKQLSKLTDTVQVARYDRGELTKWVGKRFKQYEKNVDLHAVNYFIEMINYLSPESTINLYDVDNGIRSMSGVNEPITEAVINRYIEVPIEHNIFKMMDAISSKQMSQALLILNHFVDGGEPEIKIFYLINQQFRNIYKIKLLLEAGHTSATIASKLEVHPFVAKKAGNFAMHFSKPQLRQIIERLEEVDLLMKSSGLPPLVLIEKVLFQIYEISK